MIMLTKDEGMIDLAVFDNNDLLFIMVTEKLQIAYIFKECQRQCLDSV